jgi:hypothetical protein
MGPVRLCGTEGCLYRCPATLRPSKPPVYPAHEKSLFHEFFEERCTDGRLDPPVPTRLLKRERHRRPLRELPSNRRPDQIERTVHNPPIEERRRPTLADMGRDACTPTRHAGRSDHSARGLTSNVIACVVSGACPTSGGPHRALAATYSRVTPCPLTRAANGVRSCGCLRIGCATLHH